MAIGTIHNTAYKIVSYSHSYTVSANGSVALTADDMGASTPSGYAPVAITLVGSGNSNVAIRYANASATGSNNMVGLKSVSSSSITASASVSILYLRV